MSFGLCFAGVDVQQRFANVFAEFLLKVVFVIKQGQVNVMNNGVGVHKDAILCLNALRHMNWASGLFFCVICFMLHRSKRV